MATHDQSSLESASFDLPLVAPNRRMTEEEFVSWCDQDARAEWVDGEVIMMSPVRFDHADLFRWLLVVLSDFVENNDLGTVIGLEFQVRFASQRRRRVPDILFVSKARRDLIRQAHFEGAPDLIMEIVSPESESRDWREKYNEYEAAGVPEYWVIDPMSEHAELYSLSGGTKYQRIAEQDGKLVSAAIPGFWLRTEWLWPATRPTTRAARKELGVI